MKLFSLIFDGWLYIARCLILWLIIALFIPGLGWYEHVNNLLGAIAAPAGSVFYFFDDYYKSVLDTWNPNSNPLEDGVNLFLMLGGIVLMLGLPVLYFVSWIWFTLLAIPIFIPSPIRKGFSEAWTVDAENNWHLLSGRTTVQDTYDAEVQANAIASALNKYR